MDPSYDIVIVGGGTAGLAVASRLSEDASLQIVVLESGEDRRSDPQVLTPGMWPLLAGTEHAWAFKTVPQKSLQNSIDNIPQGRLLGGSSGINSFLFTPTSQASVDGWAKLGNKGWEFANFARAVNESYTLHSPSDEAPKGNGPIQLRVAAPKSEPEATWTKAFLDGLATLGFSSPQDAFSGHVRGGFSNPESVDPATKQRSFSANTYLGLASGRPNLKIITGSTVTKILLSTSNRKGVVADGVQYTQKSDGESKTVRARKEVIISCGTFNSPRLLELSGIGDDKLLKKLGIKVVIDNPQVGENLQNHVYTGLTFEVEEDAIATLDPFFRNDPQAVGAAMEAYGVNGTGPLSSSSIIASAQLPFPGIETEAGEKEVNRLLQEHLNWRSPEGEVSPRFSAAHAAFVQSILLSPTEASSNYVFGPAYTEFENRTNPANRAPGKHITIAPMLSHPLSRGSVHITTAAADGSAANHGLDINPRYLSHPLDIEVLARHILFVEQSLSKVEPIARFLKPQPNRFADITAVKDYVRRTAKGAHHYTGSCSMMPKDLSGVVDHELRVYGTLNLRVCDASVLPITPRANTQAVVYGVAEMGAKTIKETLWDGS
ncbi:L-sorbose 1-dehydrogenase [Naviculisporaceae sp. PSN 640]